MIRVTDLDKSINFYTNIFGMNLLRKKDFPDSKFTLAFVGYGNEADNAVIELTHNWETDSYDMGNAFGHIAIAVADAYKACDEITAKGGDVVRPAGPMKHGGSVIAFVKDPDGYMIELIEGK
jgi:lactoylglutathione lyase